MAAPTPERLTLYVRPEYKALLQWAQEYTQARSLSEAVFSALADLKALVKARQLQALEETQGMWKDDANIADAFKEVEEGWEKWRGQLEGS
jgi:hypothetical protein